MEKMIIAAVVGVSLAAAAFALPGDLVVVSDKEVRPDEAAGLYYLGSYAGGYLYNGSSAAVGRVAPYRLLDRDAKAKEYYIVWAPDWVGVTPAAFEHLGTAVRLSEYEILVGLEPGLGSGALRAVEHRIELIKLEPVTPVEWRYDGEVPPARKSRAVEAAVNSITEQEYAGYIKRLEDLRTRYVGTPGSGSAREYIRSFFENQGLKASVFPFKGVSFRHAWYPGSAGHIFILTNYNSFKRTRNGGEAWDTFYAEPTNAVKGTSWLNENVGFVVGRGLKDNLVKTTDGGDSWDVLTSIPREAEVVYFVNEGVGWAGGKDPDSFIVKTTDGGKTWQEQVVPAGLGIVNKIDFFDATHS